MRKPFEKIDCLKCARCCKGYSPVLKVLISKEFPRLRNEETAFIEKYQYDDEGDYVAIHPVPFWKLIINVVSTKTGLRLQKIPLYG
jgi:hypothetical protein